LVIVPVIVAVPDVIVNGIESISRMELAVRERVALAFVSVNVPE
jgi:hypothetical protein